MTGHRERLGVNPAHSAKHSQPSSQRVAWSYRRQEYTSKRREGKNMRKDKMLKKKMSRFPPCLTGLPPGTQSRAALLTQRQQQVHSSPEDITALCSGSQQS